MGLIIDHADIEVAGLSIRNKNDDPKLQLAAGDYRRRPNTWVRGIVLHTTRGIPGGKDRRPQEIRPGMGPDTGRDERLAQMWARDSRKAGVHLAVDHDGSVCCFADLHRDATYHAGNVNNVTIGIEIYQGSDAELYEGQLEVVVKLVDALTRMFGIQRQVPHRYLGRAVERGLRRGIDMVGVYGHRDCSNNRGRGDPGDHIMGMLADAGYETYNYALDEDLMVWEERQRALGVLPDGIAGPATRAALWAEEYAHGLWVSRPGD